MPTISRSSNQKIGYLINILSDYYIVLMPSARAKSQEDKESLIYGSLNASKPLFEELNNRNTTILQKAQIIVDYLNQNCQGNCTQDNINSFWYDINTWLDSNKESVIQDGNGNRLFDKIIETIQAQNARIWTPDIANICLCLLERVSKLPDKNVVPTQEQKSYTDKLLKRATNTVINKLSELPERKIYIHCNTCGVFVKGYQQIAHSSSSYGKAWFTKTIGYFPSNLSPESINQLKDDQKYWIKHIGNKLTFGLELECSVPEAKFQAMVDKFIENGLADHNFINIGTDNTIHSIPGYKKLEIKTVPLPYDEAMEKWSLLGKIIKEFDGKFGDENGCGGHIHMDKPETTWEQIRIANHFAKLGPKLPEIFNRGKWDEDRQIYLGGYHNDIGSRIQTVGNCDERTLEIPCCIKFKQVYDYNNKLTAQLQNEGKLSRYQAICSWEWKIIECDRTALNFRNDCTVEFRGFNSRPDPEQNLKVLAKEVAMILGNERVYGNGIGVIPLNEKENKIFGIPENTKQEFTKTLESLGYDNAQIEFANKLAFNKTDTPEQMLKTAIDCINEFKAQKELEKQDELEIDYEYVWNKEQKAKEKSNSNEQTEGMEM